MNTDRRNSPSQAPRQTKRRKLIAATIDESKEFLTAQQVHAQLRDAGESVGLATVYRALQSMAENNEVDWIRNEEGEVAYRSCSDEHHHHLICRRCGKTIEVFPDWLENWTSEVAAKHGYTQPEHLLEIWGLCPDCS